uniref:Calmodulin-lysine N-methyltransferase n=1 Tax=Chrysotila carterae TaxID=13221 RepID=A0A7S4C0G0_CHRCT|eukprot:2558194-Pleurochrysis_carterae.AAC.7
MSDEHNGSYISDTDDAYSAIDIFDVDSNVIDIDEREWQPILLSSSLSIELEPAVAAVWGSALLVAQWLARDAPSEVRGKRVLELGAGTSLPSLASAAIGASLVLATDYDLSGREATQRAIDRNRALWNCSARDACHIAVQRLDWFAVLEPGYVVPFGSPFDVLLVCDCNYYTRSTPALVQTIRVHLGNGGRLVLASREGRNGLADCLRMLHEAEWICFEEACCFCAEPFSAEKIPYVFPAEADSGFAITGQAEASPRDLMWLFRRVPSA